VGLEPHLTLDKLQECDLVVLLQSNLLMTKSAASMNVSARQNGEKPTPKKQKQFKTVTTKTTVKKKLLQPMQEKKQTLLRTVVRLGKSNQQRHALIVACCLSHTLWTLTTLEAISVGT